MKENCVQIRKAPAHLPAFFRWSSIITDDTINTLPMLPTTDKPEMNKSRAIRDHCDDSVTGRTSSKRGVLVVADVRARAALATSEATADVALCSSVVAASPWRALSPTVRLTSPLLTCAADTWANSPIMWVRLCRPIVVAAPPRALVLV